MTETEYLWAWAAYVLGAGAFFAVFWYSTRKMFWSSEARMLIRLILLVILAVPWSTEEGGEFLSPAWIISIADGLLEGEKAFWRAGLPLALTLTLSILLSTVYLTVRWFRSRSLAQAEAGNS